jgi:CRISPR-associated protein Cmr4
MTFIGPQTRTYLFQTIDPLHVGTGGTRLGRVDNTVVRDPATRLPKIPGSGMSGAVKDAYDLKTLVDDQAISSGLKKRPGNTRCAGSKGCGKSDCPVCTLFGTAPAENRPDAKAKRGLIAFRDAFPVAVPVSSITGPIWITGATLAAGLNLGTYTFTTQQNQPAVAAPGKLRVINNRVSIGTFLFDCPDGDIIPDNKINAQALTARVEKLSSADDVLQHICSRLAVCGEGIFPHLVETAMEVRTSVSIDPETGAAEDKKLFTSEAVPAGTLFQIDLNFLGGALGGPFSGFSSANELFEEIEIFGFPYLALTGIGGNVTRGFGRVRFLGYWKK